MPLLILLGNNLVMVKSWKFEKLPKQEANMTFKMKYILTINYINQGKFGSIGT